jgi:uncharacterized membrane protein
MAEDDKNRGNIWSFGMVGVTRIETITDGVLAIAMTILVLELSLDEHVLDSISHGHFSAIFPEIMSYVMGFLVLGVYWVFHHFMLHFIKRSDGILSWLNILFLMFAALVPLSTKVNNFDPSIYSSLFYFVTAAISIIILWIMWQHATRGYRLVSRDIDKRNINFVNNSILIAVGLFAISIFGQLIDPIIGYIGFASLIYIIAATVSGSYIPFVRTKSGTLEKYRK